MLSGQCHTRAGAVTTAFVKEPIRAALGMASLFALCSFLIAVLSLVACRLDIVDIIRPLPDGPVVHPVTSLSVILLASSVVLTMQRVRWLVDGACTVVLLVALAQITFPDRTSHWFQAIDPLPAGQEPVVSTSTALCQHKQAEVAGRTERHSGDTRVGATDCV